MKIRKINLDIQPRLNDQHSHSKTIHSTKYKSLTPSTRRLKYCFNKQRQSQKSKITIKLQQSNNFQLLTDQFMQFQDFNLNTGIHNPERLNHYTNLIKQRYKKNWHLKQKELHQKNVNQINQINIKRSFRQSIKKKTNNQSISSRYRQESIKDNQNQQNIQQNQENQHSVQFDKVEGVKGRKINHKRMNSLNIIQEKKKQCESNVIRKFQQYFKTTNANSIIRSYKVKSISLSQKNNLNQASFNHQNPQKKYNKLTSYLSYRKSNLKNKKNNQQSIEVNPWQNFENLQDQIIIE